MVKQQKEPGHHMLPQVLLVLLHYYLNMDYKKSLFTYTMMMFRTY